MDDFHELHQTDISAIGVEGWPVYYETMAPWLMSDDRETRCAAIERLTMATFRAEPGTTPYRLQNEAFHASSVARMEWLLGVITQAHATHHDVMPAFLSDLRHHGDHAPFDAPLARWLASVEANPPASVDPHLALGARLLVQPIAQWSDAVAWLVPMLDHAATYPRACAAYRLSHLADQNLLNQDSANQMNRVPSENDIISLIVEKEIHRPGVLGPFWSQRYDHAEHPEKTLWLIDVLERRQGSAPRDLPFNDIEFYLHELCGHEPALVQRFLDKGFEELACMAATEHAAPIEGMEPILRQLMRSTNPQIASSAARHLANQYGVNAPRPPVSHPAR